MTRRQPQRRSHIGEHANQVQSAGKSAEQQEVSRTTYVEGHAAVDKPGMQRLEIRTLSMCLNPEDPKEPTETSTKTTKTKTTHPSSPIRRQPHVCRTGSFPLQPIQERTDSFAASMQRSRTADDEPLVSGKASFLPVTSKTDKHVLGCIPVSRFSWPLKVFKRKAETTGSSSKAGDNVNKVTPAKAVSEGILHKLMIPIKEDHALESSTNYLGEERMSSPEPMPCTCEGAINDAGYPDVVSAYIACRPSCAPCLSFFVTNIRGILLRQISIASCSDEQTTFEGPNGLSVTQVSSMYVSTHGIPSLTVIDPRRR